MFYLGLVSLEGAQDASLGARMVKCEVGVTVLLRCASLCVFVVGSICVTE